MGGRISSLEIGSDGERRDRPVADRHQQVAQRGFGCALALEPFSEQTRGYSRVRQRWHWLRRGGHCLRRRGDARSPRLLPFFSTRALGSVLHWTRSGRSDNASTRPPATRAPGVSRGCGARMGPKRHVPVLGMRCPGSGEEGCDDASRGPAYHRRQVGCYRGLHQHRCHAGAQDGKEDPKARAQSHPLPFPRERRGNRRDLSADWKVY
mmetsp:Transcript_11283/g.26520  ORF Transcript_11283/g.26520 Transcript_11283/m.26520 type:complete len:208 (-) Transcript_11283:632-1255(-)